MNAIKEYLHKGGKLEFTFAGGGLYALDIKALAEAYEQVNYLGIVPASEAAHLVNQHRWALLPIDDDVTKYAFPSKTSGYALSGAGILAVCGAKTSVARWVDELKVGMVCEADHHALVNCFFSLEDKHDESYMVEENVRKRLLIPYFAKRLRELSLCEG